LLPFFDRGVTKIGPAAKMQVFFHFGQYSPIYMKLLFYFAIYPRLSKLPLREGEGYGFCSTQLDRHYCRLA
jgi:hypothetical protein